MEKIKKTIQQIIADIIPDNIHVLDMGCGDGTLLNYLITYKKVTAHGVDINPKVLLKCIEKNIPAIQLDLNNLPLDFSDDAFDFVILNQTLQETLHPDKIIKEMLRIGKKGILGFLNFGTLKIRVNFLFSGQMPVTKELPFNWFNTPNIHLATIKDFINFCKASNIKIEKSIFLKNKCGKNSGYKQITLLPNLRSDMAIFVLNNG